MAACFVLLIVSHGVFVVTSTQILQRCHKKGSTAVGRKHYMPVCCVSKPRTESVLDCMFLVSTSMHLDYRTHDKPAMPQAPSFRSTPCLVRNSPVTDVSPPDHVQGTVVICCRTSTSACPAPSHWKACCAYAPPRSSVSAEPTASSSRMSSMTTWCTSLPVPPTPPLPSTSSMQMLEALPPPLTLPPWCKWCFSTPC